MKTQISTKNDYIKSLYLAVFLFIIPASATFAACCTDHGGVASCDKMKGVKICKDGTASPSCTCPKVKAAVKKTTTQSKTRNSSNTNAKGCCSGHGGVTGQCDKTSGYQRCKDGKISTSCRCN
ncbi:MAG: hypothetical protein H0U70_05555 [Tatlockia sp.]|nr:hypothetical protein [Tatlockia sp.]